MAWEARLATDPIQPDRELARFMEGAAGQGAVVTFSGIARPASKADQPLEYLFLDHYPGMTERSLEAIAAEGLAKFDVAAVTVVHRCGKILPGETIVFVAASSKHRREASRRRLSDGPAQDRSDVLEAGGGG